MKKFVRAIVFSPYIDVIGAVIVLFASISRGFHLTFYIDGQINWNVPLTDHWQTLLNGGFPIGYLSTIGAVFSLLSTRFVGKQSNTGNWISLATTVNSGSVDYFLGNHSAIITYPVTFLIHSFATYKWSKGVKIKKIDVFYYLIFIFAMGLAYILVWLGMKLFPNGMNDFVFYNVLSLGFGLSLGANFCTAFKYESTYLNWTIYNIIQLMKAVMQINIANIAKYIFYLLNAVITLLDWLWNRDKTTGKV
jgi:nicotinamide mononucleotide transporter